MYARCIIKDMPMVENNAFAGYAGGIFALGGRASMARR